MSGLRSRIRGAFCRGSRAPAPPETAADERVRRTVARLAAGVAHDLNNILLVLQGYSEMAVEESESSPGIRALLDEMHAATHRASLLVRDLQFLGDRGQMAPRLVDLSEVVRRSLPAQRAACPAGCEIQADLSEGLPSVKADDELLARVFGALCARARESMQEGGTITVSTASAAGRTRVTLVVADTGGALSVEARERMFEPYAPGPSGSKGQGLGMSVVQAAARRLGGELLVTSGDRGTTIELQLPAAEAADTAEPQKPEPRPAAAPPAARPRSASGTILVAEDDEGLRALAVKVLTREGYRVISARDGQEAVEMFAIADRPGQSQA